jgi:hypothetical protein
MLFLAWLLLVAGVAAGAWFVVDAAGEQVGGPAAPADVVLPAATGAYPTPSSTPGHSETPSATKSPGGTPSASPSPSSGRGVYNWQGSGLVVRCEGTAVAYWAVRPADGWRVSTSQVAVSALQVVFEGPGGRAVVMATCRASGPDFSPGGASPSPAST